MEYPWSSMASLGQILERWGSVRGGPDGNNRVVLETHMTESLCFFSQRRGISEDTWKCIIDYIIMKLLQE